MDMFSHDIVNILMLNMVPNISFRKKMHSKVNTCSEI